MFAGNMIHDTNKTRRTVASSKSTTIDDLPDSLLIEILCRLPRSISVFRCKCLSKRWLTLLLSDDRYFIDKFLRIKHDQQVPLLHQFIMIPPRFADHRLIVLTISSSNPPLLQANTSTIFDFLPCFQGHEADTLYVPATYNDLVLCSPTKTAQRDYYICNPYTKKWLRLPPTPPRVDPHCEAQEGFICEPYYNVTSSNVKLNPNYRFRVARLLQNEYNRGFKISMFSSEIGEWKEYPSSSLLHRQRLCSIRSPSVACNGKLYWLDVWGFVLELDPFSPLIQKCRYVDLPYAYLTSFNLRLGVCRGRLQMMCSSFGPIGHMYVCELNDNGGKSESCVLHNISSMLEFVHKQPMRIPSFPFVGFDPVNGDIVYLKYRDVGDDEPRYIVMCNLRERTLENVARIPFENKDGEAWSAATVTSYVIPWWPTPLQARLNYP